MRANRGAAASETQTANGASAGRPRSEVVERAIMEGVLKLLEDGVPLAELSIERIARTAGVGKATIYRRWRSKLPLVVEAFSLLPSLEEVDSGDLVTDLKQMLRAYLELFNSTPLGTVLPSLAGERRHNPALSKLLDPVLRERRRPLVRALERAVERGELPRDLDLELAVDLIVGPIAVRLFFSGGKPSSKLVDPIVDLALSGLGNKRS